VDWIGLSSVLRPRQAPTQYRLYGRQFLQVKTKDPTNSIKVMKVHIVHRQIKYTIIKQ